MIRALSILGWASLVSALLTFLFLSNTELFGWMLLLSCFLLLCESRVAHSQAQRAVLASEERAGRLQRNLDQASEYAKTLEQRITNPTVKVIIDDVSEIQVFGAVSRDNTKRIRYTTSESRLANWTRAGSRTWSAQAFRTNSGVVFLHRGGHFVVINLED